MKRYLISVSLFVFCPLLIVAQAPDTAWTKTYGGTGDDYGYSVLQTNDGGYIIVGSTASFGAGGMDVYIIKTDPNGDTVSIHYYGGPEDDEAFDIKPTLDGHYIIAGYTRSFECGGPCLYTGSKKEEPDLLSDAEIWFLEIDSMGDTISTYVLGGSGDDIAYSIIPTADGHYVVTGNVPYGLHSTVFLLKTDAVYWADWMQIYPQGVMGTGNIVQQTSDNGYIIAAQAGYPDMSAQNMIFKTDSIGIIQWEKHFYGCSVTHDARVLETTDGYMVAGVGGCGINQGEHGIFLSELNTGGDTVWFKIIYPDTLAGECNSFQPTNDGTFVIAGETCTYDILLIKANGNGDTIWTTTCGGTAVERGFSARQTMDNGYIVTGFTESYGAGGRDVYLVKFEPDFKIEEQSVSQPIEKILASTIFSGPLVTLKGKKYCVFDIAGRKVDPVEMGPGVYFVEINGQIAQKVIKVR